MCTLYYYTIILCLDILVIWLTQEMKGITWLLYAGVKDKEGNVNKI